MKKLLSLIVAAFAVITANAQMVFVSTDFESGIPAGWTQSTDATDGGFNVGTGPSLSSDFFPIPDNGSQIAATNDDGCNCNKENELLILPAQDFSTVTTVLLQFDMYYAKGAYQGIIEHAYVAVSTDNGATWADVEELPGEGTAWQNGYKVDLSAYAGQSNVMVAFRYTDSGDWLYGIAIDNVSLFAPLALDARLSSLSASSRYNLVGENISISGTVANDGLAPLTSFDIKWSDGTNTYTDNITGVNIAPLFGTYDFTHTAPLNLSVAKAYNLQVWVENTNGTVDGNATNNQASTTTFALAYAPARKMVAEEATGTWCVWCPRGTEWMDFMAETYPDDFIGIAVHNNDPMAVAAYDAGLGDFPGFSGYPSVIVDRVLVDDPAELENLMGSSLERLVPADIPTATATLDVATRKINIEASTKFATAIADHDFRFNVVLVEDGVTGTGAGYNQANAYAGAGAPTDPIPGFGYDWDAQPNPAPAAQMVYNHVGRAILGGWAGTAGSIPATAALGENVSRSYTNVDFNAGWNPKKTHAVVMILDNASGEVVNAGKAEDIEIVCPPSLGATATITQPTNFVNGEIDLTPPANSFGFGGYTFMWSNGETTADLADLSPGIYTVTISDKFEACSQVLEVEVTSASSVEDIASLTSFSLTPNPAATVSVLNATFSQPVELNVNVISMDGKVVKSFNFENATVVNHSMDLSNFADGMYMVKMSVGTQVRTERLVVTK